MALRRFDTGQQIAIVLVALAILAVILVREWVGF
jgi:hypothetical protein